MKEVEVENREITPFTKRFVILCAVFAVMLEGATFCVLMAAEDLRAQLEQQGHVGAIEWSQEKVVRLENSFLGGLATES